MTELGKSESNGWSIYFHPEFEQQFASLESQVVDLRRKLPAAKYVRHSRVKLLGHLARLIHNKIPTDPMASHFALRGNLKRMSRAKKMGLPDRYRLFFKVFPESKQIVILWLGHPRKEGDKNDCYTVFQKRVERGEYPEGFDDLMKQ